MKLTSLASLLITACSLNALQADAVPVVLADSFTTESATSNTINYPWANLNYTNFQNWNVTRGSVDLVNLNGSAKSLWFQNYNGPIPTNSFVDLDGTSRQSGQLTSKNAYNLTAGNYRLTFDVAGNLGRLPNAEGVTVKLDGLGISQHYELASGDGFTTKTIDFTVTTPTSTNLSFTNENDDPATMNDNQGPLIGNINLTNLSAGVANVPEPGTLFIGAGLLAGLYIARRYGKRPTPAPAI